MELWKNEYHESEGVIIIREQFVEDVKELMVLEQVCCAHTTCDGWLSFTLVTLPYQIVFH